MPRVPARCPRKGRALLLLLLPSPLPSCTPQGKANLLAAVFQIPKSREAAGALLTAPRVDQCLGILSFHLQVFAFRLLTESCFVLLFISGSLLPRVDFL